MFISAVILMQTISSNDGFEEVEKINAQRTILSLAANLFCR